MTERMKNYSCILFDLDGTIIDSSLGITNSCMHALKKLGIPLPPREELYKFIGPPLTHSFSKYYGMSASEAELAVEYYREYYRDTGIFEITPYDGIRELLTALSAANKKIVLATSKPEQFAKRILEYLGFSDFFTLIAGSTFDHTRDSKKDVIKYALDTLKTEDTDSCIMIGDREHDIIGAHSLSIAACGVLYGFGSLKEFTDCNADYIASTPIELRDMLI